MKIYDVKGKDNQRGRINEMPSTELSLSPRDQSDCIQRYKDGK